MSLRTAYQEKLQAQVEEQKAQLDLLKARAKRAAADGKIMAYEEIAAAEEKLARLKTTVKEFAGASGDALREMKAGAEKAFHELKEACQKASARFDAKEEPKQNAASTEPGLP